MLQNILKKRDAVSFDLFIANGAGQNAITVNRKAPILSLDMCGSPNRAPAELTLRACTRAIADTNYSAHRPGLLATFAVDSSVLSWDWETPKKDTDYFRWQPHERSRFSVGALCWIVLGRYVLPLSCVREVWLNVTGLNYPVLYIINLLSNFIGYIKYFKARGVKEPMQM
jgi:hypothetical protein